MPKRCRRDEARIRNFGHQKKQRTSNHEDKENAGGAIPAVPPLKPLQTRTFLQPATPLSLLGLHNVNAEVTGE